MRKPWSLHSRMKARERFWKPVYEQSGLLIDLVSSGHHTYEEIVHDLGAFIDGSIFGNRLNSPPFYYALLKELREHFGYAVA
jgi:hypothetical protein